MVFDNLTKEEVKTVSSAIGVIVFSVISIATFAMSGGTVLFYVMAVLTIAVGLYMAYSISKEGKASVPETKEAVAAPKRGPKRKGRR